MYRITDVLQTLKNDLVGILGQRLEACYLIGSTSGGSNPTTDVDVVTVVVDTVSTLEFLADVAPVLWQRSQSARCLVTCFPVRKTDFEARASQFIRNVYEFGIEF